MQVFPSLCKDYAKLQNRFHSVSAPKIVEKCSCLTIFLNKRPVRRKALRKLLSYLMPSKLYLFIRFLRKKSKGSDNKSATKFIKRPQD